MRRFIFPFLIVVLIFVLLFVSLPAVSFADLATLYWQSTSEESYGLDLRSSDFNGVVYTPDVPTGANMFPWPSRYYPGTSRTDINVEIGKIGWYEMRGTASTGISFRFLKNDSEGGGAITYEDFNKAVFVVYLGKFDVSDLSGIRLQLRYTMNVDGVQKTATVTRTGAQLQYAFEHGGYLPVSVSPSVELGGDNATVSGEVVFENVWIQVDAGVTVDADFAFALYNNLGILDNIPQVYRSFYAIRSDHKTLPFDQWQTFFAGDEGVQYVQSTFEIAVTVPVYSNYDYILDFNFGFVFAPWSASGDGGVKFLDVYSSTQRVQLKETRITYDEANLQEMPYPGPLTGVVPKWCKVEAAFVPDQDLYLPEYVTFYFVFALDSQNSGTAFCSYNNKVSYTDYRDHMWGYEDNVIKDPDSVLGDMSDKNDLLQDLINNQKDHFLNQEQTENGLRENLTNYVTLDSITTFKSEVHSIIDSYAGGFMFWAEAMDMIFLFDPARDLVVASVFMVGFFMILRLSSSVATVGVHDVRRRNAERRADARAVQRQQKAVKAREVRANNAAARSNAAARDRHYFGNR